MKTEWDEASGVQHSYASYMHPNSRFYKYLWWVFWEGSPRDGAEFLTRPHALCTAEAMALMDRLVAEHKPHWVYNRCLPRHEPGVTPFDPASPRWAGADWAPAFLLDPDPEWQGSR